MSSSIWARAARTCLIRPRIGSGPLLTRSFVLLAAKPTNNALLRSIPLITRQQSSVASARVIRTETAAPSLEADVVEEQEKLVEFASLKDVVDQRVLRALTKGPFNLTTMSTVQAQVLPLLPAIAEPYDPQNPPTLPRDLLVRAKTGTGKTLAFLIPAVEARLKVIEAEVSKAAQDSGLTPSKKLAESARRRFASKHTGVVVISPTRELATQIAQEAIKLTKHLEDFQVQLFVGGESKSKQLREFRKGTHDIIVATPGRLRDMLDSSAEVADSVAHTRTLILDEADSLLDMGFQADILGIQEFMPKSPERQTFLFSATVSRAIRDIARASLAKQHKYINCVSEDASPVHAHIPQYHTVLPSAAHQIPHVLRVLAHDQLANPAKSKSIVFLPTTRMTQLFAELLRGIAKDTLPAARSTNIYEIHSKKSMESRTKASNAFRNDRSGASILVTSDVSARGVDYPGVTRVVQVGIPSSAEQYIHRVGRTGRAGTQGRGDLILLPWERGFVSWQMTEVPLKPLTADDLTAQTLELAKTYEADPKAFFGGEIPLAHPRNPSLGTHRGRPLFQASVAPMIEDIPRTVSETVAKMDEAVVSDTFMSLLGYYLGRTTEMKVKKSEVLEECKQWCVQACGMETPPTVSRSFLDRLGFGKDEKMDRARRGGFREPRRNEWASRGQERVREEWGRGRDGERGGSGGGFRKPWEGSSGKPWEGSSRRPAQPWEGRGSKPREGRESRPAKPWEERESRPAKPWEGRDSRPARPWEGRGRSSSRDGGSGRGGERSGRDSYESLF